MRRCMLGVVAAVGMAFAAPGASGAQTPQDSVTLTGGPAQAGFITLLGLDATSGPAGEHPTGQVRFEIFDGAAAFAGPVTCLAVSGHTAIINFQDQISPLGNVKVLAVDGQPDSFDLLGFGQAPTDCSPLPPPSVGGPLSEGDITIIDAPPLPTSKDQCKNGGWRTYGLFKNQGDCVRFVATRGKNQPGKTSG